ncbi:MAG: hypothetical protein KDC54_24210, partial [Lewinella sp.]|nr:hypothetical protein [Lewinella sp.]
MKKLLPLFGLLSFLACEPPPSGDNSPTHTLIVGATVIDLEDRGRSEVDLSNAYVLLKGDEIIAVGEYADELEFPEHTTRIDASGKYLLPGLFDGFAAINNQAYCDAYLYMGITSIIAVDGGRRGGFFGTGDPSPDIYHLEGVGQEKITTTQM